MRHEDGPFERRQHLPRDRLEAWGPRERARVEPVHVRCAAHALPRVDQGAEELLPLAADDALDAHLDDAVVHGVEPGHLQVDEGERCLGDGQIPGRSGGGRGHVAP